MLLLFYVCDVCVCVVAVFDFHFFFIRLKINERIFCKQKLLLVFLCVCKCVRIYLIDEQFSCKGEFHLHRGIKIKKDI